MHYILSRREFLLLVGVSAATTSCKPVGPWAGAAPPSYSPFYSGPYNVGHAILGITPGTTPMPRPISVQSEQAFFSCANGPGFSVGTPEAFQAMVYYPGPPRDPSMPIEIDANAPTCPVVLYAHARRDPLCPPLPGGLDPALANNSNDFKLEVRMLDQVSSYGCVVVVPDLSGFSDSAFDDRSSVLVAMYQFLLSLNTPVFMKKLDLGRIVLVGHSTGGGACLVARGALVAAGGPKAAAIGLLAPVVGPPSIGPDVSALAADQAPNALMVLKGTLDSQQGANPDLAYASAKPPRMIITVPGANHFGYTDICTPDNKACAAQDSPGAISAISQQITGGAYLAALVRRFALNDMTVEPYLSGQRIVEVGVLGVTGIQVTSDGM